MTTKTAFRPVAELFLETAARLGERPALIRGQEVTTFERLAADVRRLSAGLRRAGLKEGDRVALLVPPSRDFYALTFACFRAGLVPVFIDPGIGFSNMGRCLEEAEPRAFIGSAKAHLARLMGGWAKSAELHIVADGKVPGFWNTKEVRALGGGDFSLPAAEEDGMAAILFTSGSTGAPKGAVYAHGVFSAQVAALREMFHIKEGEVSLPTFPLFGLFDAALGLTCVLPDMDFTRPGSVRPSAIIDPAQKHRVSQLFGSPALLDRVSRYAERHGIVLPDLKRVMSAGAPVPARVIRRVTGMLPPGVQVFTPYGATEALPVALIGSDEILSETAAKADDGAGVCVGRPAPGVEAVVIKTNDEPIAAWSEDLAVSSGTIGEIVVKGPAVTRAYWRRPEGDAAAKIRDGDAVRHRMGDLGYLDEKGRLWFVGRKSQRVRTNAGDLHTVAVEGVFDAHPAVKRTALVAAAGRPVLCVEREPGGDLTDEALERELLALGSERELTRPVKTILFHPSFPVDTRHNAKIFREKLAVWAQERLS